jgi:thiamine-monophosphate kinase
VSRESAFIDSLRALASHPAARGLTDDAAVLEFGGRTLVLTHDMLVEGIHFLPDDPPEDVAWKLVAVNLSDLAAKGARPVGVLIGYSLAGEAEWDRRFVAGLETALHSFSTPLLGGDTVSAPGRTLSLTAIGEADGPVPSRSGGEPGDRLWVSGSIGDSGAGLRCLRGELPFSEPLVESYRRPTPRLAAGARLAPLVRAMMDVSDGLLIDAARLASASRVEIELDLAALPISEAFTAACGGDRSTRLAAATAGDDYELLFAAPPGTTAQIQAVSEALALPLTPIGLLCAGAGLRLTQDGESVPLPASLGWEHGGAHSG